MSNIKTLEQYITDVQLTEGERSFYVSGNKVRFTRGQEHVSVDITKGSARDLATEVVAPVVLVEAMTELHRKLKREPSYEELAEEADDLAHSFAVQIARHALHMGASDFRKIAEELFPGLAKEAPKEEVDESLQEGFHVPDNELKMERRVKWYDPSKDRFMSGNIVNVTAHNVTVNDAKFGSNETFKVTPDLIIKVWEKANAKGKEGKLLWSRG